jgi:flagellar biosynthesis/type III secretory pathway M-ring protein FliF/YscJ
MSPSFLRTALLAALVALVALAQGAHARKMLQVLYGTSDLQTRANVAQNSAQQAIARAFLPTATAGSTQAAVVQSGLTVGSVAFGNNGYLLNGR